MPSFESNFKETSGQLQHYWEHTVGSGHAPLALRADWQHQLAQSHRDLGFRHVRFHGLLSDDMGTLTCQQNEHLYSFFNADQIFDFLLSIGMRPFVELSFMPATLASGNDVVFSYKGNVTPPKDYEAWGELIRRIVSHWIDRYGLAEVRKWYFEVWNEPNLDSFWTGSQEDYFHLYRVTVETIKNLDAELCVGGPVTAKNEWIEAFVDFCNEKDVPADFVSTHQYPTDAFGQVGDNTVEQLAAARRSVLREQQQDAKARAGDRPLFYTEWNTSSNPRDPMHDESYAAAFVAKTILEAHGLVDCYSFWTFSDIFEENYFPSKPFQGGFGLLNLHGIPKPSYRAYQLLHHLGDELLHVDGHHETVDAWAVRGDSKLNVLLTNGALPKHPITSETVHMRIPNAPQPRVAHVERIDREHANPKRVWQEMGEPRYLSQTEVHELRAASALVAEPLPFAYENGVVEFDLTLPPQAVASVTMEFSREDENG